MRSTSDILFNVLSQTLRHRVRTSRPSSATFAVFADGTGDDGAAEFSGTATVDSVSTTLAAAAGSAQLDQTAMSLTSAAGVTVGRRYLLSEVGRREWVQLVALDGTTAYAATPLANAYTTAAAFVSTDITAAIDATWVADESNLSDPSNPEPDYRIKWTITPSSGATEIAYTFFDLVRGSIDHNVTIEDVAARLWFTVDDLPIDHRLDQGARIIQGAWEDCQAELAAVGLNDAALRDAAMVDQFHMKRIALAFARNGKSPAGMTYRDVLDDYERFYERHIAASAKVTRATSSSGATTTGGATRLWGA